MFVASFEKPSLQGRLQLPKSNKKVDIDNIPKVIIEITAAPKFPYIGINI